MSRASGWVRWILKSLSLASWFMLIDHQLCLAPEWMKDSDQEYHTLKLGLLGNVVVCICLMLHVQCLRDLQMSYSENEHLRTVKCHSVGWS